MKGFNKTQSGSITLILFCLILFFLLAANIHSGWLSAKDDAFISVIQRFESAPLTRLMLILSFLGSTASISLLTASISFFLFFFRSRRLGLYMILTVAFGAGLLNRLLKLAFKRERPSMPLIEEHGYSFPSGHAMTAAIFFGAILFCIWKINNDRKILSSSIVICLLLTLGIGISRIYLGVHFPSDVLAGYTAGLAWVYFSILLFGTVEKMNDGEENVHK
ncbi:MAG TPA: phosphatase PAP2 family protein [Bacillaceae bacterium]